MTSPDKKLMQKGWNSDHFDRVRNAYARIEDFVEAGITPHIKSKKNNKCVKAKKAHSYIVIKVTEHTFIPGTSTELQCENCGKKKIKTEWFKK